MFQGNSQLTHFAVWNNLAQGRKALVQIPYGNPTGVNADGESFLEEGNGNEYPNVEVVAKSASGGGDKVVPVARQFIERAENVMSNYGSAAGSRPFRLVFEADLPALGYATYEVREKAKSASSLVEQREKSSGSDGSGELENEFLKVSFKNHQIAEIHNKKTGRKVNAVQK
jgi:hypothetical protein